MAIVDGIDQSWGYADPKKAAAAGIKVVSMYLSKDPTKNVTAAKVKAYHAAGIGVILNWEQIAGAPLNGANQGLADAGLAVSQARALIAAVGYAPKNRTTVYFSCDRDVNSGQYPSIDAYYRSAGNVVHAAGFGLGAYGERDLVQHLSDEKITDAEWQTLAWSNGLSPDADFYQSAINKTLGGASVDYDRIIHADQLGAWWPPGHALDSSSEHPLEDDMTDAQMQQILAAIKSPGWATSSGPHVPDTVIRSAIGDHVDTQFVATAKALSGAVTLINALGTRVSQVLTAQAAMSSQLKATQDELTALKSGHLNIDPTQLTGTVTVAIGGTK